MDTCIDALEGLLTPFSKNTDSAADESALIELDAHAGNPSHACEIESTMRSKVLHVRKALFAPRKSVARRIASDAVVSGTAASLASAAALMAASASNEGSFAGGLNGPSQWLWGEDEAYTRRLSLRHTATGYAIHHATSIFWAVLHETIFGASRRRKSPLQHCAEAAASAGVAYVVDYHLTPRRFRPGFEKHVSRKGMVAVYAAFAAGLAIAAIARDRRR
jgi:hypothetical protein